MLHATSEIVLRDGKNHMFIDSLYLGTMRVKRTEHFSFVMSILSKIPLSHDLFEI